MTFDNPLSVCTVVYFDRNISSESLLQITEKVGSSIDLCMGGVVVFSIDQDNRDNDLMSAIWDAGGLIPPADEIALGTHSSDLMDFMYSH